jgi:hypothetical protein
MRESMITTRYRPKPGRSVVPTFRSVGHFGLPVHFVASPELHGRFKCCPDSRSTSTILSTYLAMFCTSATFTATAFPSPSPPCHFLCTSHIPSLTFLPYLLLPPQIPICFPDCFVPILAHLLSWHGVRVPSTCPFALLEVPLECPYSVLSTEPKSTPI